MSRVLGLPLMLLALFGLTRSTEAPPTPLAQDAYVWQRVWTPALLSSLHSSLDLVSGWRVLAAETDAGGTLKPVAVNWQALRATERPVIAVVRIDGFLQQLDQKALLAQIGALVTAWRKLSIPLTGIEIDYDCATSKLEFYAGFLARLRTVSGVGAHLSITALPTWLSSPRLGEVVAQVEEIVLQVHAVRAPDTGLFDPDLARQWIDEFAARTTKPFRVALPDYGARVIESEDGRILAIESEMPRLAGGDRVTDIVAMPRDVSHLLAGLETEPPRQFAGVVWFRLPTEDDDLTWSLPTWRAVVRGQNLRAVVVAAARSTATPGMSDIVLVNESGIDAPLPRTIGLPADCRFADGANGYAREDASDKIVLRRLQSALLRGHSGRTIGWARCISSRGNFDVSQ